MAREQYDESVPAQESCRTRVLLADDHHELLNRVTAILDADFDVVGSAAEV